MRRLLHSLLLAVGLLVASAPAPAHADTTVTTTVAANSTGDVIGSATFTRTASGGTDTLRIHLSVSAGISESHVCLSSQPFTSRVNPGSCPYSLGATGTTADYTIDLGSAYEGQPVYAQVHVVSKGATAYAGWHAGSPFYGNVEVRADLPGTTVPVGMAGSLGLALLLAVSLLLAHRQRVPAKA